MSVEMKTLTIGSTTFEVVDGQARTDIGDKSSLATDTKISMVAAINEHETQINTLTAAVGSPLVASTVAAMTDQTKVYVYTGSETGYTAGNWYYYNGSAWVSGGVYNAAAVNTDKTLSVSDQAADAKVTGDEIADLKSALGDGVGTEIIEWTKNAYIRTNLAVGSSVTLTPTALDGYRCAVVDCEPGDRFIISVVGKSTPRAWAFIDSNNILLAVSPTMKTFTDYLLIAPANAAKIILNDAPTGGVFNTVSIKGMYPVEDVTNLNTIIISQHNGTDGGDNYVYFEQGSGSFQNGIFTPSNNDQTLRSYRLIPILLYASDEIIVDSEFKLYAVQVRETTDGCSFVQNMTSGYVTGKISIRNTGQYIFFLKRSSEAVLAPAEAKKAVILKRFGYTPQKQLGLPRNPYKNIVWSAVLDRTSVSHAHCTEQAQFNTLKNKYDHLAISNYHPSIPYYPLTNYFNDAAGVMCSPNAEHFEFDDVNSSVHMNSVGGLMACEDGGYNGTIFEAIEEGCRSLIMPTGGGMTLNHPKWSGLTADEVKAIISFNGTFAIEIWNATCEQLNGTGFALDIWDDVLSDGIQIFGTCVPDHEAQYRPNEDRHPFGYNHMLINNDSAEEVLHAYRNGKFYGTLYNDGLLLKNYALSNNQLSIEVSQASTFVFITATRSVPVNTASTTATFTVDVDTDVYVRCEVTRGSNKLFTNAIMLYSNL